MACKAVLAGSTEAREACPKAYDSSLSLVKWAFLNNNLLGGINNRRVSEVCPCCSQPPLGYGALRSHQSWFACKVAVQINYAR